VYRISKQFCLDLPRQRNSLHRGLIQSGAKAICIHGRTRGSTKNRRCGPADLLAIGAIARTIHEEFNGSIPVISNGNITTPNDVTAALREASPCVGVMSAEGILANPAVFYNLTRTPEVVTAQDTQTQRIGDEDAAPSSGAPPGIEQRVFAPSLLALYREYCALTTQYKQHGGWQKLDAYYTSNYLKNKSPTAENDYIPESRQIYIARQHLAWMLGKSGHGRMVRYTYIGACYKKHVHLMQALNEATSIDELLSVAEKCLPN